MNENLPLNCDPMRIALMCALALLFAGCIYIPTPEHGLLEGRGRIREEDIACFEAGKTTRADVLLRLGEPETTLRDESVFLYSWMVTRGYIVVAGYYAGDAAPVGKVYLLLLEFGADGRLLRRHYGSPKWFRGKDDLISEWVPSGPVPMAEGGRRSGDEPAGRYRNRDDTVGGRALSGPAVEPEPDSRATDEPGPDFVSQGRYLLTPTPQFPRGPATALPLIPDHPIRIGTLEDARPRKGPFFLGYRGAWGMRFNDVWLANEPAASLVRRSLADALRAAGYRTSETDGVMEIRGTVDRLEVSSPWTPIRWYAEASVQVTLQAGRQQESGRYPFAKTYDATARRRGFWGPFRRQFEEAVTACLEDVGAQVAGDTELGSFLESEER